LAGRVIEINIFEFNFTIDGVFFSLRVVQLDLRHSVNHIEEMLACDSGFHQRFEVVGCCTYRHDTEYTPEEGAEDVSEGIGLT